MHDDPQAFLDVGVGMRAEVEAEEPEVACNDCGRNINICLDDGCEPLKGVAERVVTEPPIVFRPGSTTPGEHSTWESVMLAAASTPGPKTIEVGEPIEPLVEEAAKAIDGTLPAPAPVNRIRIHGRRGGV